MAGQIRDLRQEIAQLKAEQHASLRTMPLPANHLAIPPAVKDGPEALLLAASQQREAQLQRQLELQEQAAKLRESELRRQIQTASAPATLTTSAPEAGHGPEFAPAFASTSRRMSIEASGPAAHARANDNTLPNKVSASNKSAADVALPEGSRFHFFVRSVPRSPAPRSSSSFFSLLVATASARVATRQTPSTSSSRGWDSR